MTFEQAFVNELTKIAMNPRPVKGPFNFATSVAAKKPQVIPAIKSYAGAATSRGMRLAGLAVKGTNKKLQS